VAFHREIFLIDTMLAGGMEMELGEREGLIIGDQRPIGDDNFQTRAQVLEPGAIDSRDGKIERADGGIVAGVGDDIDRRLMMAI
jgi:hypothetical protein